MAGRKVWFFGAPAPGVDADIRSLRRALDTAAHPDCRFVIDDGAVCVGDDATRLGFERLLTAIRQSSKTAMTGLLWVGARGAHEEGITYILAADASRRADAPRAGDAGAIPVFQLLCRLRYIFSEGDCRARLLVVLDICHAEPIKPKFRLGLPRRLIVLGASEAGQIARADEVTGGFLTQALVGALEGRYRRPYRGRVDLHHLNDVVRVARQEHAITVQTPWWINLRTDEIDNGDLELGRVDLDRLPTPAVPVLARWREHCLDAHGHLLDIFRRADGVELVDTVYVDLDIRDVPEAAEMQREGLTLRTLIERDPARRWAVLGSPGAGKSTLARHLAWTLSAPTAEAGPIPVLISMLRWVEAGLDAFSPLHVAEESLRRAERRAHRPPEGADGLAQRLLETKRPVWVLLDGLDEVEPKRAADARAAIADFAARHPEFTVIVLSRPIGYDDVRGFERARVEPLTRAQQLDLLVAWLDEEGERWRGDRALARIGRQPRLREAAETPLLLSLIALLARDRPQRDLPADRSALYAQALDLLIAQGYSTDRPGIDAGRRREARWLMGALALELGDDGDAWELTPLEATVDRLCDRGRAFERKLTGAFGTASDFLRAVSQTGILGPREGPNAPWRFLHRSLGERLAAEALAERGAEAVIARVQALDPEQGHADALGRWGETLGMACALLKAPSEALTALREADAGLTLRVLPELTGLPLALALDTLWGIDPAGGRAWDGDALAAVLRRHGVDDVSAAVMDRIDDTRDLDRLAFAHYALAQLEAPFDRVDLFARSGRPVVDDLGLVFAPIPAGDFLLGSKVPVLLGAFEMATTPVTWAQYRFFDADHARPGHDQHPVTGVSWWRARLFAAWAGADVRLPTEAEWEYACRAGTTTRYWSGDGEADLARVGWYNKNSGGQTHPVGAKDAPNRWGLHDMHGNVWEWCRDWYGPYPPPPADGAPLAGPAGPADGAVRVFRGGSFGVTAHFARSAYRGRGHPEYRDRGVGFRLVRAPRAPRP